MIPKINYCESCGEKIDDTYYYKDEKYYHIECMKDRKICKECGKIL